MVVPFKGVNMAYIAPNSTLQLFKNIPLTDNYSDTLFFASNLAKDGHFDGLSSNYKIGSYLALTYNRHEQGIVRIEAPMSTVLFANYMRFKNTSFENKWFYAFVTDVNYVNNSVTEIKFEIDYMMTWMGEFSLAKCFVERMHSITDTPGGNIVNEGFNFDEYVYNNRYQLTPFGSVANEESYAVVILYAYSGLGQSQGGTYYDGVYSGLGAMAFKRSDISGINGFIDQFSNTPDSIIAMYMCKEYAISSSGVDIGGSVIPTRQLGRTITVTLQSPSNTLNGYTPRNKKLLTYPYTFCCIDNGQGNDLILRYEFCNSNTMQVDVSYNIMNPVSESLRPVSYKGASAVTSECLTLTGYPVCSWSSDAFKAWFAQNAFGYGVDIVKDTAGLLAYTGTKKESAQVGNLLDDVASIAKDTYSATLKPDIVKGNVANGNNLFASGYFGFHYGQMCIPASIAQIIDGYFDAYGYAFNTLMQPSMTTRPYWTYVKTRGCIVEGTLPSEHAKRIESIIDNGCRFWRTIAQIGNYSLDNSPIDIS